MHTIPYADIKKQLYAAQYGQSKPLEEFMLAWMFDTIGCILSPLVVNIDAGKQEPMQLEIRFPRYEARTEVQRHRVMGTNKVTFIDCTNANGVACESSSG